MVPAPARDRRAGSPMTAPWHGRANRGTRMTPLNYLRENGELQRRRSPGIVQEAEPCRASETRLDHVREPLAGRDLDAGAGVFLDLAFHQLVPGSRASTTAERPLHARRANGLAHALSISRQRRPWSTVGRARRAWDGGDSRRPTRATGCSRAARASAAHGPSGRSWTRSSTIRRSPVTGFIARDFPVT